MKSSVEAVFKLVGYLKGCHLKSATTLPLRSPCTGIWGGGGDGTSWATRGPESLYRCHHAIVQTVTENQRFPKDRHMFALFLHKKPETGEDPTHEQVLKEDNGRRQ